MEPLYILLLLLCRICEVLNIILTSDIIQETGIRTAEVGETVTFPCSCQHEAVTYLFWYHQSLGGKPHIVSKRMKHIVEAEISPAYEKRFKVLTRSESNVNDLVITDLLPSDSGTYFCAILEFNAIEFGRGVFLHVKTSLPNTRLSTRQPALKLLRPGASVNLSCSVSADHCEGDRSLYWLRHAASQPALMYPSTGNCKGPSNGTSHGFHCTSKLELNPVRSSDAGTYYCALASCGLVVFGEGTKVEMSGTVSRLPVYCLSAALALSTTGLFVLSFLRYKLTSKLCCSCKGMDKHLTCSEALNSAENQTQSLHYAALNLRRTVEGQRQDDDVESACVYSRGRSRRE